MVAVAQMGIVGAGELNHLYSDRSQPRSAISAPAQFHSEGHAKMIAAGQMARRVMSSLNSPPPFPANGLRGLSATPTLMKARRDHTVARHHTVIDAVATPAGVPLADWNFVELGTRVREPCNERSGTLLTCADPISRPERPSGPH